MNKLCYNRGKVGEKMKKILSVLLIMFIITGCQQGNSSKQVKSKVRQQEANGIAMQEGKAQITSSTGVELPVVGDNKLIVIDAGHQRYGNSSKEPIGPGASTTKAKVTTGATGVSTGKLESEINLEVAFKLQEKLVNCNQDLANGEDFVTVIKRYQIYQGMPLSMIQIGFKTGQIDEIMTMLANHFQDEVSEAIGRFLNIIEPSIVAFLSLIVGVVLISVMLPLISIMASI